MLQHPPPPPCWPPVYAGAGLGSRDDIALGTDQIPHYVRRGYTSESEYKLDEERHGIFLESEDFERVDAQAESKV